MFFRVFSAIVVGLISKPSHASTCAEDLRLLAARAQLPMPKVYLIREDQPNAFATGRNPQNAAVAATTGLLDRRLAIEPPPPAPIVVVDPVADFRTALDKRPDYQQAQLALHRSDLNARLQRNQLLPRVDLVGSYGYNGLDSDRGTSRRLVRDQDYRSYSWGVVVSVPLTFTTERGRYRAAKLGQRQAATQIEQLEQAIVVQVGNAAGQIETAQKRIQANRQARELAQATLDAEVKRLRVGQSSTFFVAQQQELLSIAEVREAAAMSDYHKALADYDRQLGITLEKLNVTVEPPK